MHLILVLVEHRTSFRTFPKYLKRVQIIFSNQNDVQIQQNNTQSCKVYQNQVQQLQIKYQQAVSVGILLAGVVFFMILVLLCCFTRRSSCGTMCYQKSTSCFRRNQLYPESNSSYNREDREDPEREHRKKAIDKLDGIEKIHKVDEFAVCLTGTPVRSILNTKKSRQPVGISFV